MGFSNSQKLHWNRENNCYIKERKQVQKEMCSIREQEIQK